VRAPWPEVTLSVVADLVRGVSYPKTDSRDDAAAGYVPVLRATNIQDARLVLDSDLVYVAKSNVSAEQHLRPGDIVVATSSGSKHLVGKSAILHGHWNGSFGAFCAGIRPKPNIESRYLAFFLHSPRYWKEIGKKALGVNINNLRRGDLETLSLPLPPMATQHEIVAEIEKQFSRLDEAVANLQRVKANLKRYKAAVLTAAVSGNLVEIEAKRSTTTEEPAVSGARIGQGRKPTTKRGRDANSLGPLPEGWVWAEAADLASPDANSICAGPFGTIFKAKDFRSAGVPIIFLRHVAPLRYLDRKPGFMDPAKWEELFKPYSAYGGELLITKLGEPPGVCAMYPCGIGPAMVTPDVIKMNVDPSVASSTYVMSLVR